MNKKRIIIIVCILAACIIAAFFLLGKKNAKGKLTVEMTKVEKGNLDYYITATGTVEPVTKVDVGTQVSGIVDKLYADYNSNVKKDN